MKFTENKDILAPNIQICRVRKLHNTYHFDQRKKSLIFGHLSDE